MKTIFYILYGDKGAVPESILPVLGIIIMLYTNNFSEDKEHWYVYFIRFKKNFVKTKFVLWYDTKINLWFWEDSVKIWSTHNKTRIQAIWHELYEHDLWIENIEIVRVIKCKKYRELEVFIQKKFKDKKCKFKHEFFSLTNKEIYEDNYEQFWYISEIPEFKIIYTQYKYFLKSLNAIVSSNYHKENCIKYNKLLWWKF